MPNVPHWKNWLPWPNIGGVKNFYRNECAENHVFRQSRGRNDHVTTIILGANGRIGSVLHRHAKRAGVAWLGQTRTGHGDIHWSGQMTEASERTVFQPGATLINMIGSTSQDAEDLHKTNVEFVRDLLVRAADTGVAHVILASSAAVYGNVGDASLTEDTSLAPLTPYGISKARMEDTVQLTAANNTLPAVTVLRIGNVAGCDALLAAAIRKTKQSKPMQLHRFLNGRAPLRSYIGPSDLFDVIHALSLRCVGQPRTLNISAPEPVSLDAVLNGYKSHLLPELSWKDAPVPIGIPARVVLSTTRLEAFINMSKIGKDAGTMARQVAQDRT